MAIREGRWQCHSCGTEQLGRHAKCQSCGKSKPAGTKHYLPEDAPEVTDPEQLRQAEGGANKVCRFCDSQIGATATECTNCGSVVSDAERAKVHDYAVGEVPTSRFSADVEETKEKFEEATTGPGWLAQDAPTTNASRMPDPRRPGWLPIAIGAGTLLLVVLWWLLVRTHPVSMMVVALRWERSITVEDERTVREADWSIPSGGRQVSSQRAIHHYDHVVDHYDTKSRTVCEQVQSGTESYTCGSRDKGNGYFEDVTCSRATYRQECREESYQDAVYRDDPVYATRYSYDIERWFTNRVERSAASGKEPRWPVHTLGKRERVGPKTEQYTVSFMGPKRTHEFDIQLALLLSLDIGQHCIGRMNALGAVTTFPDCSDNVEPR